MLEQVDIHGQKHEPQPSLTPCAKTKSKWIVDINIKYETIKVFRKEKGNRAKNSKI